MLEIAGIPIRPFALIGILIVLLCLRYRLLLLELLLLIRCRSLAVWRGIAYELALSAGAGRVVNEKVRIRITRFLLAATKLPQESTPPAATLH